MVLRSSLALGSGAFGVGVNCFEVQRLRSSVPSLWSSSTGGGVGRVSSLACAGVRRFDFAPAIGVVRMSATPADGQTVPVVKNDDNLTKSVMVRIHGKVQGVFYRNWTVETAKQLGVNGWVRNNKDGSVEAVFSGKSTAVDTLIEKCVVGPPAAKVSNVEATPYKDTVTEGFERRPTICKSIRKNCRVGRS